MLDPELLAILVCPACRSKVASRANQLVCQGCGRRYPVRDGIPIMLVDEAEPAVRDTERVGDRP